MRRGGSFLRPTRGLAVCIKSVSAVAVREKREEGEGLETGNRYIWSKGKETRGAMGALFVQCITFGFLLFAVMESRGSPAYGSILSSDLSDLKDILSRLEDKLPVEEAEAPSQDLFAQNYDVGESSNSASSWAGEAARPQTDLTYSKGSWGPPDKLSPLKSKLRELFNAPRSFRRSDCFGSRIDKIGAQSGMGCNSRRI